MSYVGDLPTQGIIDAIPASVAVLDRDGRIVATNASWKRFSQDNAGWPDSDGIGTSYLDVCRRAADDPCAKQALELVETALAGEVPARGLEYPCASPDHQRWFLLLARPLGPTDGAVVTHVDISDRVLMETRQHEASAHLRLVMHSLPDAVFTISMPERRIDFVNEEVTAILGYSPAEVIGETTRLFYPDDESFASFGAKLVASLERGDSRFRSEEILQHKDGRRLHCEVTVTFKRDADELIGVISTVRSVEERWQAQEALRQRQEQWDRFATATNNMLWNWDFASDRVDRNIAFQTALGYSAEEVTAKIEWWVDRLHPDDRQRVLQTFEAALEAGHETTSYTYRFRRRDDTYATIRDRVFIMRDEDGRAYRSLGAMIDITEQARHEEEIRRANNLESLGLLAGGIAHDFNNQLTGILARTELLGLKAEQPAEVRRLADQLGKAAESAARLTRQLLTFSKGGAPNRESAALGELVREQVAFSLRGSSTRAHFLFKDGLWPADIDTGQIGQLVQNLAINADQAMADGGSLWVEARNVEVPDGESRLRPGRYVELRLTDDGPGIPESDLQRIFDPYYTTKPTGHGLGLAICHSIVDRHGGSIRAESVQGNGTTFVVLLPAATQPPRGEDLGDATARGAGRVLLVDDLEEVRASMSEILRALGYHVDAAASVQTAVESFRHAAATGSPYGVVVTDLTIPGTGGGLEVLRQIKALDPEVPVIVASGYASDPVMADHRVHGFDEKIAKPVRMRVLAQALASVLDKRRTQPQ